MPRRRRYILSHQILEKIFRIAGWLVLPSLAWLIAAGYTGIQVGLLAAFFVLLFSASCGMLRNYRNESGLWMLALVFTPLFIALYLFFIYQSLVATPVSFVDVIEFTIATGLLWLLVRVQISVFHHNRVSASALPTSSDQDSPDLDGSLT
jgi:hypothetical protein